MRDECFIRGNIPMTKSEVRAVSLSKMELRQDSIVYDIGAGTGSVSVEAALAVPMGHVYAIEQNEEGCSLICRNAEKFSLKNLTVICGKAPDVLQMPDMLQMPLFNMPAFNKSAFNNEKTVSLPKPNCAFIGGTGGNMEKILDYLTKLNPKMRIVMNVIALETLGRIMEYTNRHNREAEFVGVWISRGKKVGDYHLMQGQNPVYIITIHPLNNRD